MCQETSTHPNPPTRPRRKYRRQCNGFCRCRPHHDRTYSLLESIPEGLSKESFIEEAFPFCKSELPLESEALNLVNRQRALRKLPPFQGSPELFRRAERHCETMAQRASVEHSVGTIEELVEQLGSPHAAENVQRGESVAHLHFETFSQKGSVNYNNIFSTVFTEFGAAYLLGMDGRVYLCQLFRN